MALGSCSASCRNIPTFLACSLIYQPYREISGFSPKSKFHTPNLTAVYSTRPRTGKSTGRTGRKPGNDPDFIREKPQEAGKDLQGLPFLPSHTELPQTDQDLSIIWISHPAPPRELVRGEKSRLSFVTPKAQRSISSIPDCSLCPVLVFNLTHTHRTLLHRRFSRCQRSSNPSIPHCVPCRIGPAVSGKEGGDVLPGLPPSPVPAACPAVMDGYWFWLHPTQRSVTSCQAEVTANPSAWRQPSLADCSQGHWGLDSSLPLSPLCFLSSPVSHRSQ